MFNSFNQKNILPHSWTVTRRFSMKINWNKLPQAKSWHRLLQQQQFKVRLSTTVCMVALMMFGEGIFASLYTLQYTNTLAHTSTQNPGIPLVFSPGNRIRFWREITGNTGLTPSGFSGGSDLLRLEVWEIECTSHLISSLTPKLLLELTHGSERDNKMWRKNLCASDEVTMLVKIGYKHTDLHTQTHIYIHIST